MRKLLTVAVSATATMALAAGAVAQVSTPSGDATLDVSASPSNSGTAKNPKNVSLGFKMDVAKPGTTVETITVSLPRGLKFSGKGFKPCDAEDLLAQGTAGCSSGSKAGPSGTATAKIEPGDSPLNFTVRPYVEDANTFLFYLVEPGGIQTVVKGEITNRGRKMAITIPLALRQPAGLDATLTGINQVFSGKRRGKYIVSSTTCIKRKWAVTGSLGFATRSNGTPGPAPQSLTEKVRCSK